MVLQYNLCGVGFPNRGKFSYPGFLQGLLNGLLLVLPYPGFFSYPVKASILKYDYFQKQ